MSAPTSKLDKPRKQGAIADFFLHTLFVMARHTPFLLRRSQSLWVECGWRLHKQMREGLLANAARILGPCSTRGQRTQLARDVTHHFYRVVTDFAESPRFTREQLLGRIAGTVGHEGYRRAREQHTGAIIATAHLGCFEVGMAALTKYEKNIHVVFHRDAFAKFEQVRSLLRRRLGIQEAAAEEGWPMWLRLRDALAADEVVLLQADRVMPGQKGKLVPFMGGHTPMPTGPVRLAILSGSPIIPVFAVGRKDGRVDIMIEEPIVVDASAPEPRRTDEAMLKLAAVIGKYVRAYPQQWLMTRKAWVEDKNPWE